MAHVCLIYLWGSWLTNLLSYLVATSAVSLSQTTQRWTLGMALASCPPGDNPPRLYVRCPSKLTQHTHSQPVAHSSVLIRNHPLSFRHGGWTPGGQASKMTGPRFWSLPNSKIRDIRLGRDHIPVTFEDTPVTALDRRLRPSVLISFKTLSSSPSSSSSAWYPITMRLWPRGCAFSFLRRSQGVLATHLKHGCRCCLLSCGASWDAVR